MGALIVGYVLAGSALALTVLGLRSVGHLDRADEDQLRYTRQNAESPVVAVYTATWSLLSVAGAIALLVHGHPVGLGWLGVALLWAGTFAGARIQRRRVLRTLGDRGRTVRSPRNQRRLAAARRWATAAIAAYATTFLVGYAYPDPLPEGTEAVRGALGIFALVASAVWLVFRTLVYTALDDDKREARRQEST
ncbi:hypothetical protein [Aeromicrobium fastidiosum]|uniref:Uncharacterized protein n=1 Tax=Aeromicrobium fastidiosum TaxID=52699 RepID=A0A641AQS3_9ACTN|nr:hypothetical protein [Aeromicrobium fastidiosum]KAA1380295.1 hypothetical protein ESP62_003615 [Aeromicrobium fastidiosum]MBP2389849.1 hypothetical protein [Aeromicrobium fastidiosum]